MTSSSMALCPRTAEGTAIRNKSGDGVGVVSLNGTVLAGTAFARAGEIEEALETLGADSEDLEAYVLGQETVPHFDTLFLQCSCDRTNLPLHQPTRPCQEGVRACKALGGG